MGKGITWTILPGEETAHYVENMTYGPKQVREWGVDLTIKDVREVTSPGAVDFGGSEFTLGKQKNLEPVVEEGQEYGWWDLKAGHYLIRYNEKFRVPPGRIGIIQPSHRITRNGCFHPSSAITGAREPDGVVLVVGHAGVRIKQNARISRLLLI